MSVSFYNTLTKRTAVKRMDSFCLCRGCGWTAAGSHGVVSWPCCGGGWVMRRTMAVDEVEEGGLCGRVRQFVLRGKA